MEESVIEEKHGKLEMTGILLGAEQRKVTIEEIMVWIKVPQKVEDNEEEPVSVRDGVAS